MAMAKIRALQPKTPSVDGTPAAANASASAATMDGSGVQISAEAAKYSGVQAPSAQDVTPKRGVASWLATMTEALRDSPKPQTAHQKVADKNAISIMRDVVLVKDKATRGHVIDWSKAIETKRDAGVPLTVHEHTALAHILSSGFFGELDAKAPAAEEPAADQRLNAEVRDTLTKSLASSWLHLTGKPRAQDKLLTRLPKMALRKASREARVYHEAAFIPIGDRKAQKAASSLFRGYVPENKDVIVATAALLASAFSATGAAVVGTTVLQYGMYSLSENLLHDHLAHPRGKVGQWCMEGPKEGAGWLERAMYRVFGKPMKQQVHSTAFAHEFVHHAITYRKSFTEMFDDDLPQEKVDELIKKNLEKQGLPPELLKDIQDEQYATMLNGPGLVKIFSTVVPQTAAMIAAGAMFGAPAWCLVPVVLLAAAYPLAMGKMHPEWHIKKDEAKEAAGLVKKAILESRWAAHSGRNHWMHHHADGNFNLSIPGADALMGHFLQPNLEDLLKMRDGEVLHYADN